MFYCPFCEKPKAAVISAINFKPDRVVDAIWRRRECRECGERFGTVEYLENPCDVIERMAEIDAERTGR